MNVETEWKDSLSKIERKIALKFSDKDIKIDKIGNILKLRGSQILIAVGKLEHITNLFGYKVFYISLDASTGDVKRLVKRVYESLSVTEIAHLKSQPKHSEQEIRTIVKEKQARQCIKRIAKRTERKQSLQYEKLKKQNMIISLDEYKANPRHCLKNWHQSKSNPIKGLMRFK